MHCHILPDPSTEQNTPTLCLTGSMLNSSVSLPLLARYGTLRMSQPGRQRRLWFSIFTLLWYSTCENNFISGLGTILYNYPYGTPSLSGRLIRNLRYKSMDTGSRGELRSSHCAVEALPLGQWYRILSCHLDSSNAGWYPGWPGLPRVC